MAIALRAIICASVLQLAQPYLMKLAIDRYIANGDLPGLDRIALVFLVILAASFLLEYLQTWVLQMTGQRIMFDLRMQIYGHLQRLDLQFFDRNPVGRLMTRVTTDVDVLNDMFTAGVVSIFGDVFTLVGIMIVLVIMDWRLALVAFAVLPLIVLVTQWFRRHVRDSYRTVRTWIARINAFLQEHITGMGTVQLFRRERRSFERFETINRAHRDANVDSIFYYAVFYPAIEVIGALASALIIWFGGGWTMEGTLTLGSLVAFLQYSQRFFRPISDMSEKFNVLQAAMASSERIFTLLDTEATIQLGARRPALGARNGGTCCGGASGPRSASRLQPAAAQLPEASRHVGKPSGRVQTIASAANAERRTPGAAGARPARPHPLRPRLVRLLRRGLRAAGRLVRGAAGERVGVVGRHGRRQVHADQPAAALLRRQQGTHPGRRGGCPRGAARRPALGSSAWCCRTSTCSPAPLPRTSGWGATSITRRAGQGGGRRGPRQLRSSSGCRSATPARSRSGRHPVGRTEAAAVVRPRARLRSRAS